jgi:hypothetical protein
MPVNNSITGRQNLVINIKDQATSLLQQLLLHFFSNRFIAVIPLTA